MEPQQPVMAASRRVDDDAAVRSNGRGGWVGFVFGKGRSQQIRLMQWLVAVLSYAGGGLAMWVGFGFGWVQADHLLQWAAFAAATQVAFYTVLRSGVSVRFADPGLTTLQAIVALLFTDWSYLVDGPCRGIALVPMLLVLIFGAFSLHWKTIASLTAFALASFAATIAALEWMRSPHAQLSAMHADLKLDLTYFVVLIVMLPAAAGLAAQLSHLRSKLRFQRSALTMALDKVQRLATSDDLTGLANRRHARHRLQMEQARSCRGATFFSVVLIDLDHFKRINDTLGHDAGDRALQSFATAAGAALRSCDLIARWGGEEFLVIMPDTDAGAARAGAVRLLERIGSLPTATGEPLTFSAGVAQWETGETYAATVMRADQAMYAAKRAGRNRVHGAIR